MDEADKNVTALRANEPDDMKEGGAPTKASGDRRSTTPPLTEAEELPAEGAPELRDIPMRNGVDHPDGRR